MSHVFWTILSSVATTTRVTRIGFAGLLTHAPNHGNPGHQGQGFAFKLG